MLLQKLSGEVSYAPLSITSVNSYDRYLQGREFIAEVFSVQLSDNLHRFPSQLNDIGVLFVKINSAIERESIKMGLAVNENKTKYIVPTSRNMRHIGSHIIPMQKP